MNPSSKPPASDSGWDSVAGWYDKLVGLKGSDQQQKAVIPAVMELLHPQAGESVLDVACGQGILASFIAESRAKYTGVDASKKLLEIARKHHSAQGVFLTADARKLSECSHLHAHTFDAAVVMLAIQDMDPLDDIFRSIAWALKPAGRVVFAMTHPGFRVPRQSSWGWDEQKKWQYRRIDRYLTPLSVPMKAFDGKEGGMTTSFHRPLQAYFNGLATHRLFVTQIKEIPLFKERLPGERAKAEFRSNQEIPQFLVLHAEVHSA